MKASVWYGGRDIRVEDVELPDLEERDVRIKVALCGVCGTDLHIVRGEFPLWQPPAVLGHEYVGVVEAVGPDVRNVQPGDRVAVDPSGVSCGACSYCRAGAYHLCPHRRPLRGAFAEYTQVPDRVVYRLPKSLSFERAVLAEPLSCAVHAVDRAALQPGESVLIIGGGTIGLLLTMLVQRAGASHVMVSEPRESRRVLALELGADEVVDPAEVSLQEVVRGWTSGLGADVVFEAVGAAATTQDGIEALRRGGRFVMVGVAHSDERILLSPYDLYWNELTLLGSHMRRFSFERTLQLLTKLPAERLISREYGLSEVLDAIDALQRGLNVKSVVRP